MTFRVEVWGVSLPLDWIAFVVGCSTLIVVVAKSKMSKDKKCISKTDLTGKTAIVTGANTGIGYWTALALASRNARVIIACRSKERGRVARNDIVVATGNENVVLRELDLFNFDSVRQFVEQVSKEEDRLDILVNNAGIAGLAQQPSDHGLEITMATNHFGPFLLTLLLKDLLKKSAPSRIINVSSAANGFVKEGGIDFNNLHCERPQSTMANYAASKLANIIFTRELAQRLDGTDVTAYSLHPGVVSTEIWRNFNACLKPLLSCVAACFFKSSEEGARTSIYLAVTDTDELENGKYYVDCQTAEHKLNPLAGDSALCTKLWNVSAELTEVSPDI